MLFARLLVWTAKEDVIILLTHYEFIIGSGIGGTYLSIYCSGIFIVINVQTLAVVELILLMEGKQQDYLYFNLGRL